MLSIELSIGELDPNRLGIRLSGPPNLHSRAMLSFAEGAFVIVKGYGALQPVTRRDLRRNLQGGSAEDSERQHPTAGLRNNVIDSELRYRVADATAEARVLVELYDQ